MTRATRAGEAGQRGFTLAEVAVVVLIVGLLLGGLLGTYSSQVELSRIADTRKTLETARDALIGFAAANGRLPCPATAAAGNGAEQVVGGSPMGGLCTVSSGGFPGGLPGVGFFPAATLALTPADSQGYLIDAWGGRIRYAVTLNSPRFTNPPTCTFAGAAPATPDFTTQGGIRTLLSDGCANTPGPDLRVCTTATMLVNPGTNAATCASAATTLTASAVAVIFSAGKNGVVGGAGFAGVGPDEQNNLDADRVFVSHDAIPSPSANEFDDIVMWLSPSILYNRILSGSL